MQDELLIKAYYKGLLNDEQLAIFNARVAEDSAFAIMVEDYGNVQVGIAENERLRLKKRFHQIEAKGLSKPDTINYGRWLAVASVAILLGIGYLTFFNSELNTQETYLAYYEPYPNVLQPVTRGSADDNAATFSAYEAGNYEKAMNGFSEMLEISEDADVRFYYAMSLLNAGQDDKALSELETLLSTDTKFLPQAYWYAALLELKKENATAAKTNLKELETLGVTFKKEESKALLKLLD